MSAPLEGIFRPFETQDVGPTPFYPPGAVGVPPVRIAIGSIGGTRTFAYQGSLHETFYLGTIRTESAVPNLFDFATGLAVGLGLGSQ